jgi:hypothetical protein
VLLDGLDSLVEWPLQIRLMIVLAMMMGYIPMSVIGRPLPDVFQTAVQQRKHVL